jgi:GNAT superfamily N-acetyltransferase
MATPSAEVGGVLTRLPHSMRRGIRIDDLNASQLAPAARLHAGRLRQLREAVPELPAGIPDRTAIEALLRRAIAAGPAVAALRDGELIGYMTGLPIPGLRGSGIGVYVPEWASGAEAAGETETYDALYAVVSARWAEAGWLGHCISLLPGDPDLENELAWLGFGLFVVDAVLDLTARPARPTAETAGLAVERATAADIEALVPLAIAHEAYYALAPTFMVRDKEDPRDQLARWIGAPGESVWVARAGAEPLGFMHLHAPGSDVSRVVRDARTIAIGGAFTAPEARGRGVGGAILAATIEWARGAGFDRMAVDFETANLPARRFWLRRFRPVCLSFERHLDDRLASRLEADR